MVKFLTLLTVGMGALVIEQKHGIEVIHVVSYNFFTNKIDNLTYAIDEIGFSIVATYAATHK